VPFAPAGRAAGPDLAVHVEAGADDRAVAEASGDLEEEAGCRRRPDDVAVLRHRVAVDRSVRPEVRHAALLDEPADVRVLLLLGARLDPVVASGELLLPVQP